MEIMKSMPPIRAPSRSGFTLVEVLVSSFIALLIMSTTFMAAGALLKQQRLAQQKALAASFAMMIGQWRMLQFSLGVYLDPTSNQYSAAGSVLATATYSTPSNTVWNACPLLLGIATPLPSTAGSPNTIFSGGSASDRPSSANWYLASATTTETSTVPNYNLAAYQNLVVCLTDPGSRAAGDFSRFRYMTIWAGTRDDFTNGNLNKRLVFLGRFILPDGCK